MEQMLMQMLPRVALVQFRFLIMGRRSKHIHFTTGKIAQPRLALTFKAKIKAALGAQKRTKIGQ